MHTSLDMQHMTKSLVKVNNKA